MHLINISEYSNRKNDMKTREPGTVGLNLGSASILMVFAILCLTVFSALSLVTSVSEKKTAQHFADTTAAYYEADSRAVKVKADIQSLIDIGNTPQQAAAANNAQYSPEEQIITYNVPLSDNISQITAVLKFDNSTKKLEIISWEKNDVSSWVPDDSLEVWNGEDAVSDTLAG